VTLYTVGGGGAATNAISQVSSNGVPIGTGVTNLNLFNGQGTTARLTNQNGRVNMAFDVTGTLTNKTYGSNIIGAVGQTAHSTNSDSAAVLTGGFGGDIDGGAHILDNLLSLTAGTIIGDSISGDGSGLIGFAPSLRIACTNLIFSSSSYGVGMALVAVDADTNLIAMTGGLSNSLSLWGNLVVGSNVVSSNGIFIGNGPGLTNLNGTNITGYVSEAVDALVAESVNLNWLSAWATAGTASFAGSFTGNGYSLTNLQGSNIVGAVFEAGHATNADYATSASSATSATSAVYASGLASGSAGTNVIFYGDQYRTNALSVTTGETVVSNGVGSVTMSSGNVTASGGITATTNLAVGTNAATQFAVGANGAVNYSGVFACQHTPSGVTNSMNFSTVFSATIPGGAIGTNGTLRVTMLFASTGSGSGLTNFEYRLYYGTTAVGGTGVQIATIFGEYEAVVPIFNQNSPAAQTCRNTGYEQAYSHNNYGPTRSTFNTSTNFTFSVQMNAGGGPAWLEDVNVEILHHD
jgi:hypothetical protein